MDLNIDQFKKELGELLAKHNVSIGVDIKGDDCNLGESFIAISNGGKEYILSNHNLFIYSDDLI